MRPLGITEPRLAALRRTRPLAGLSRGYATGALTTKVSSPSGSKEWLCVASGYGARVIDAPTAFLARQLALAALGCEASDVDVQEAWT